MAKVEFNLRDAIQQPDDLVWQAFGIGYAITGQPFPQIPLKALERLWGYAYCYSLFFDLYQPATQGQFINLKETPEYSAARRLLLWAYEAEKTGVCPPWPDNTPRPDQGLGDGRLQAGNQIFLMMSGFILLHETAHMALGHCDNPASNANESIDQEFQADAWAAEWIMAQWEKHNRDEKVFIQRSVGIAFALAALGGIEIHKERIGERDHPNPAERLLAFLDRWMPEPNDGVLPPKATAWKVGPAVLHTHFLTAGKLPDPKKPYPTFRAYLVEAKSLF